MRCVDDEKIYGQPAVYVLRLIWKKNFAPTQKNKQQRFSLPCRRTNNRNVHPHKKEQATEVFASIQKNKQQKCSHSQERTNNRSFRFHTEEKATEGFILLDNSGHVAHVREMRSAHKVLARKHEMESELSDLQAGGG